MAAQDLRQAGRQDTGYSWRKRVNLYRLRHSRIRSGLVRNRRGLFSGGKGTA